MSRRRRGRGYYAPGDKDSTLIRETRDTVNNEIRRLLLRVAMPFVDRFPVGFCKGMDQPDPATVVNEIFYGTETAERVRQFIRSLPHHTRIQMISDDYQQDETVGLYTKGMSDQQMGVHLSNEYGPQITVGCAFFLQSPYIVYAGDYAASKIIQPEYRQIAALPLEMKFSYESPQYRNNISPHITGSAVGDDGARYPDSYDCVWITPAHKHYEALEKWARHAHMALATLHAYETALKKILIMCKTPGQIKRIWPEVINFLPDGCAAKGVIRGQQKMSPLSDDLKGCDEVVLRRTLNQLNGLLIQAITMSPTGSFLLNRAWVHFTEQDTFRYKTMPRDVC